MIIPVILAGGTGSRLWPLSREQYPKQFLTLLGTYSLLQTTVQRVQTLAEATAPLILCHDDHRFLVAEQVRALGITPHALVLEPVARNTAPAITLAALHAHTVEATATLLVLPADHWLPDIQRFHQAITHVQSAVQDGYLVTFGITPTHAETGFGYIKAARQASAAPPYRVECFVEKPDATTAQRYLTSGQYVWNSGMLMFQAATFLEEMRCYAPDIVRACEAAYQRRQSDLDFMRVDRAAFQACPAISVDYAVMEKTRRAVVFPLDVTWNDVGAWSALWQLHPKDAHDNVVQGDTVTVATTACYVHAHDRLVATVGVQDLVIVETQDAVLVAHRDWAQEVKTVVQHLQQHQRLEALQHRKVYRPWGSYETLATADRFQVKHLIVKPGACLSLQMHHHRAEHWTVVKGTAQVTRGEETFILTENQSTYIPIATAHRLANPGKIALELIEVQSGSYLGEDDIVRFADLYGRQNGRQPDPAKE